MNENKKQLRQQLLTTRISYAEKNDSSLEAAELLVQNPIIQNSQNIACYLPFRGEISCEKFIEEMWQQNKKISC